ncbi:hypothetical protein HYV82_02775 [Candidatus Woesearchaeota archaeon]|nr:hypothetical protein [Candidatus Woesearchaeota archaeon]
MLKHAKQVSVSARLDDVKALFRELDSHMTPEYVKALKELNTLLNGE